MSSAIGLTAGIVVGIVSPAYSVGTVTAVYWTLGTLQDLRDGGWPEPAC